LRTIRQRAFRHQGLTTLWPIALKKNIFYAEIEEKECHELLFIADIGKDSDMDRNHRTMMDMTFGMIIFRDSVFVFRWWTMRKADQVFLLYQEVEESFALLQFCSFASLNGREGRTFVWGAQTLQKPQHGVPFSLLSFFFSVSYHSSLRFYVLLERKEKFQLIIFFWLFVSMTSYFVVRGSGGRVVRCMSFILESWLDVCHYSSNRGIPSDELCFCILDG
jgi:hypothetical protein